MLPQESHSFLRSRADLRREVGLRRSRAPETTRSLLCISTFQDSYRRATRDRVAVLEVDGNAILIVADGWGQRGPAVADMVVCEVRLALARGALDPTRTERWQRLLLRADERAKATLGGSEASVVVAAMGSWGIAGAAVGDCLAMHVGTVLATRLATPTGAPRLGSGRAVPVAFHLARSDGTLLLASQGLASRVGSDEIASRVRRFGVCAARQLVDLARLPGGGLLDDVTVALAAPSEVPAASPN